MSSEHNVEYPVTVVFEDETDIFVDELEIITGLEFFHSHDGDFVECKVFDGKGRRLLLVIEALEIAQCKVLDSLEPGPEIGERW